MERGAWDLDGSVLASLFLAVPGIGLLKQINGEGILFSDVDGALRLTPDGVNVTGGSAVGASMGVTLQGNDEYPKGGAGNGQIISQKGEGLFGLTCSLHDLFRAAPPKVLGEQAR